ncbi:hypothetical protein [Alkalimarinus alittae]|uniref:Uncharacterized protein n=1 Tax=Alkalimarinus alittae TaxID=2961619 RepID=A0ABY6MYC3_9ALTE|nr:hypothetical protein [Alkalimarinus alittae]UZE94800.1 hypothetical protein NKI27_12000 [Alkalimarinus alittae]
MKSLALQLFFQAERELCNQMVASIRHQSQQFDMGEFNGFLSNCLDPLMVNFDGHSNKDSFAVAQAGFTHGLELASLNWLKQGIKQDIVLTTWREFHQNTLTIIQQNPSKAFSETSNVLSHLLGFGDDKPMKWLALMNKVISQLDTRESLKCAGVVCAWMSGLAHFRPLALKQLEDLSSQIGRILLGVSESDDLGHHLQTLKTNRWSMVSPSRPQDDQAQYHVERRIGRCDLLGGEFKTPPNVFASGDQLYVCAGDHAWKLYVDGFGETLFPFDIDEVKRIAEASNPASDLSRFSQMDGLSDISEVTSVVTLNDTVALTSNETFSVVILSITSPAAGR